MLSVVQRPHNITDITVTTDNIHDNNNIMEKSVNTGALFVYVTNDTDHNINDCIQVKTIDKYGGSNHIMSMVVTI